MKYKKLFEKVKKDRKEEFIGIIWLFITVLLLISLWPHPQSSNYLGPVGLGIEKLLTYVFGCMAFFSPLLTGVISGYLLKRKTIEKPYIHGAGVLALLISFCTIFVLIENPGFTGGKLGLLSSRILISAFAKTGAWIFSIAFLILAIYLLEWEITVWNGIKKLKNWTTLLFCKILSLSKQVQVDIKEYFAKYKIRRLEKKATISLPPVPPVEEVIEKAYSGKIKIEPSEENFKNQKSKIKNQKKEVSKIPQPVVSAINYILPPLELLNQNVLDKSDVDSPADIKINEELLINTLKDFGIEVKIHRTVCGPVITRYELEPAKGVKVSKITSLADDLSLVLRATHIRVVAPIPGEAAVGIEVPNSQSLLVALREILEAEEWNKYKGRIPIALGKTIDGKLLLSDLSSLPHLLIAGATGSGKSVCINTIIMSLLYKFTPKELRLLLVDPKRVELMIYNDIPHLYSPIVNDAKYATVSLRKLVVEMENRYKQFAEINARDITAYNNKQSEGKMPYIIVVIDELADLMLVAAREVETSITRLAQLARGVGIHLILATQRPSVDVITGVIKANFPSRIAFQVASKVDSRTILDTNGADKLLGKGDMLFSPVSSPKPIRGQAAYVSTEETEKVVEFWRNQSLPLYILEKALEPKAQEVGTVEQEEDKKLIKEALLLIKERKRVSITSLQGYFKIGGPKATNLASELEMLGFIGPDQGSKPREIYLDKIEEKLKEL